MFVIKRSGKQEPMKYDMITERNKKLAKDLNVDVAKLSQLVIQGLKSGMTTTEIDELSAETAAYMSTYEPEFDILAARIAVSNLHKSTNEHFVKTMKRLNEYCSSDGRKYGIISDEALKFMIKHKEEIESVINYDRDFNYSYFGLKTLERSYLHKIDGKIIERPQHMLMRVAVGIHGFYTTVDQKSGKKVKHEGDIKKVLQTYEELSLGKFTHASPTLYNACSSRPQLSSCFLLHMDDDLEHIYETNKRCALISKYAGGIGIDISNVRAKGSKIFSTNGQSDGIIPMIKVLNSTAIYANQAGKRKGSIATYLQPWHPDVLEFLQLRFNTPPEELRARDIFLGMWIPDIFMRRVENDEVWSLICPSRVPELTKTYGEEFDKIYLEAEEKKLFTKQIKAREVWEAILKSQEETGLPYMLYKDSINKKSNQKNIGLIKSSNLCTEVTLYTDKDSVAVCNLASIALPKYVKYNIKLDCRSNKDKEDNEEKLDPSKEEKKQLDMSTMDLVHSKKAFFDYKELGRITEIIVENLNNVIDRNFYPVKEAEKNNLAYRPIGIGVQGLADVFAKFNIPWDSDEARKLNQMIFETIYYHAVKKSNELALREKEGTSPSGSYSAFEGSPTSEGILQYHMWNKTEDDLLTKDMLDWKSLKEEVKKGMKNSLLISPMPTASTAQILGNNECLTGDTLITLKNGLSIRLDKFEKDNIQLLSSNENKEIIFNNKIKLINQGIKPIITLTFQDGSSIRCTKDHKFLTDNGWIEAKDLLNKKVKASYKGIEDINYNDENNFFLKLGDITFDMKTDREKILALSRIVGYLTGDGHIEKKNDKMRVYFGTTMDSNLFIDDIKLLTEDEITVKVRKNTFGLRLNIPVKVEKLLKTLNLISGRKSIQSYELPSFINENTPLSIIREFLSAHFGADGTSPYLCKPKDNKSSSFFGGSALSHDIIDNKLESLFLYMNNIQKLLLKFDIKSKINGPYKSTPRQNSDNFYKYILTTERDSLFGERIGFRYNWSKMLRCFISTSYFKYRENVIKQRQNFANIINTSDKSVLKTINQIKKDYTGYILYGGMLTQHYKRNSSISMKGFRGYSPIEYLQLLNCLEWFEKPHITTPEQTFIPSCNFNVIHIDYNNLEENVWDISVENTHNFIANSVVVHNCFEPITSNIYSRSVLAGDFVCVNKHLYKKLKEINLWTKPLVDKIISAGGSVQDIKEIPQEIRNIYKTVWEIPQRVIIDMAADRGAFIDQTQSLNIFIARPTHSKLTSMHFYGWKKGLKTGSYYIRSKPSTEAIKFTVEKESSEKLVENKKSVCTDEICTSCSS